MWQTGTEGCFSLQISMSYVDWLESNGKPMTLMSVQNDLDLFLDRHECG